MKPGIKTDSICAGKILKYVNDIKDCFEHFNIISHNDFKAARLSQFAITQIITNIYEIKKMVTPETLTSLPEFNKIKIAGARNIASHDYEQINFRMIYDICDMLMNKKVLDELKGVVDRGDGDDEQNNRSRS